MLGISFAYVHVNYLMVLFTVLHLFVHVSITAYCAWVVISFSFKTLNPKQPVFQAKDCVSSLLTGVRYCYADITSVDDVHDIQFSAIFLARDLRQYNTRYQMSYCIMNIPPIEDCWEGSHHWYFFSSKCKESLNIRNVELHKLRRFLLYYLPSL